MNPNIDPNDPLDPALVDLLRDEPRLDPTVEADMWSGIERKLAAGAVVAGGAAIAVEAARAVGASSASAASKGSLLAAIKGALVTTGGKVAVAVAFTAGVASGVGGHVAVTNATPASPVARPAAQAAAVAPVSTPAPVVEPPALEEPVAPAEPSPAKTQAQPRETPGRVSPEVRKQEVLLLDEARAALAHQKPADALAALRRHGALPVPRAFDEDALALYVMAVARTDRAQAKVAAARFLATYPDSPLVPRVRPFSE
jgi:hypothetical protein